MCMEKLFLKVDSITLFFSADKSEPPSKLFMSF